MVNSTNFLEKEIFDLIKIDNRISSFFSNHLIDWLWYWNIQDNTLWVSPNFIKFLGYSPESFRDDTITKIQKIINKEDLERAKEECSKHFSDPSYIFEVLMRYKLADSSIAWIHSYGQAIRDDSGKPIRFIGININETKDKKNEQDLENYRAKLNELISCVGDLIFILDENMICTDYSIADEQNLYLTPEMFLNKSVLDLPFPENVLEKLENAFVKLQKTKSKQLIEYVLTINNADTWYEASLSPVLDSKQKIISYILIIQYLEVKNKS